MRNELRIEVQVYFGCGLGGLTVKYIDIVDRQ